MNLACYKNQRIHENNNTRAVEKYLLQIYRKGDDNLYINKHISNHNSCRHPMSHNISFTTLNIDT